ncbi:polymer-forming cytoskeletal protein [Anaeromyxobacter terrae]|uniref:polymer-forming cytoskeletal protein n=1 Tax=Anaeromyxobacter terrae TaxID=2925406 RepID=UPI001F560173|nr:polymer-forming cytoskeletal protein [Anaeromyxobacter sp. SG22]
MIAPTSGQAQQEAVPPAGARGEDLYLAGPSVDVTEDVAGDLVAAGGDVRVGASVAALAIVAGGNVAIDGPVGGDVLAVGGDVVLRGRSRDDARLAGGNVRIAGAVDGDAIAAGGTVRVERGAVVGERAWLAGGEIVVAGKVGRELRAVGERVSIEGTVGGNVEVAAEALEIGPTARIEGNVVHRGPREPRIDPGARIGGRIEHRPAEAPAGRRFGVLGLALLVAALFATGVVMILLFPRFTPAAAHTLEADPWRSLGLGAVALLGAPALVVALFATVIGIPLGLVLLAGYPVALLSGYLVAALFLGTLGVRRLGRPAPSRGELLLGLLGALVVLRVLRLVPFLGALVSLAALCSGMGALVLRLYRDHRGRGRAEPLAAEASAAQRPT